jgi:3-phosphoinositide dependent protein kinase-1
MSEALSLAPLQVDGSPIDDKPTSPQSPSAAAASEPLSPSSPSSPLRAKTTRGVLIIPDNMAHITMDMLKLSQDVKGTGAFAKVVTAGLTMPGQKEKEVAVKIMDRNRAMSSGFINLQNEVDICANLHHECIINSLGVLQDDAKIYIVMDLAEKGELFKYTQAFGLEDMPMVAPNFVAEVVLGLEYMISQGCIHRDIKPENLLLTFDYHVKLADFGTVCLVDSDENNKFTGTPLYVSPEMLTTGSASKTSDIWALGCVLFQLFVGRPPFQGTSEYLVLQSVKLRKFEFPPYFPPDAKDLCGRMLCTDPAQRIGANGFAEIKEHVFFQHVDWNDLLMNSNETFLNKDFSEEWKDVLIKGEKVIYASIILKERYAALSVKERILILTDYPRLFYLKPGTKVIKGMVPWSADICAQADSADRFVVYTSGSRTYKFVDKAQRAALWSAKINHMVKKSKPAK